MWRTCWITRSVSVPGLSSDPPGAGRPGGGGDGASDHAEGPEPSAASVRTEELRVCVPHPGPSAENPRRQVQLLLHPVSEHLCEWTTLPIMHFF